MQEVDVAVAHHAADVVAPQVVGDENQHDGQQSQTGRPPRDGRGIPNSSDFFDFSVYIDADTADLKTWYIERFLTLRDSAFRNPKSYFHRYATLSDKEAQETATRIWDTINLVNLRENILPTRPRADLVLRKGADHFIRSVFLRKL